MLPSLLTRDIQNGLKQYLMTAYEPSDSFFRGLMERFMERDGAWMKGPYAQIGLPFRLGEKGRDFFPGFRTIHKGFTHQEAAWTRLKGSGADANTLVATGTGSGKTECFLYPVLEHCAQQNAAGKHGIKALILYPMNALATDQARRIAALIAAIPAFKQVRAGLYVGGGAGGAGGGTVMTPTTVITDRETLRANPPDILLTNYKMLDYLLIRPKDRELWAQNTPETLRYIVVDELHTFDGAQGTDLALLLRRLKARLHTPEESVVHIGTSATLGGSVDTTPLRDYARQVFGSPFAPDSVVRENRLNSAEFLGEEPAEFILEARSDLARLLKPDSYANQEEAIRVWFSAFFPGEAMPNNVQDPRWRQELGARLKRHTLFVALLRAAQAGGANTFAEIQARLADQVAASVRPHLAMVVDALLVLTAWARSSEDPALPFVTLRIQTWLRELRRMVAPLTPISTEVDLRTSSELSGENERLYLPLIQCTECHTTAWLSRVSSLAENRLSLDLEQIYNGWFGKAAETVRLYPTVEKATAQVEGIVQYACADCGMLNQHDEECRECGGTQLVRVFRPTGHNKVTRREQTAVYHDPACPVCGAANAMILIGSRSTTLGAQVVDQTWGSLFNDDRKLIAFSDSVQDAAHRAGFINARTYIHTVRKALAKGIAYLVEGSLPWAEFHEQFATLWQQSGSPLHMDAPRFVSEFIGPNMTWRRAWTDLYRENGHLPPNSPLIDLVQKRLRWQAFAEFTYAGNRGRTLERLGVATLAPATSDIAAAAARLRPTLREQFGLEVSEQAVFWWLWGFVVQLRRRGGMHDPLMGTYAQDGKLFALTRTAQRGDWMPNMGPMTAHPVFLNFGSRPGFDRLLATGGSTWYNRWIEAVLASETVLLPQDRAELYRAAVRALEAVDLVKVSHGGGQMSVGLNPARMRLFTDVLRLKTEGGTRVLSVPLDAAARLIDMPCLDAPRERYRTFDRHPTGLADRLRQSALRRVISAEHTGLLEREERESLEGRFKSKAPEPWYENLLSATPTLELGVDIGDLSSVMLCSVPPNVASFLQRIGRAGRRDGNAHATTLADGASPHDLYFFEEPNEMMAGEVAPPGIFLQAPEVLRRQFCAFCLDDWVAAKGDEHAFPDKTGSALDAIDQNDLKRFPYTFLEHLLKNAMALFDAFIDLLGENAEPEVTARLKEFVEGAPEVTPLRVRLLTALTNLADERKVYAGRVKDLRGRIKPLKKLPTDQATQKEIEGLEQEESKFQELIAEINGRELLNTLTDEGLIPNYAFPEAGVELKSVLWRRATPEDNTSSPFVSLRALRYERPASSALSEFAPENRFYANQRRVEIDQIHMGLAKLEMWRLCPNCHHMENLEIVADSHPLCPRCQEAMWSDNAQKRLLLRFRQAIANSNDTNVRIDDSVEEREPKFYQRQMLVDFTQADIREAWKLQSEDRPFGFEFIASATFRDINFGELGKAGERFKVADHETNRPGFRLCRHCGKVQAPPRPAQAEEEESQDHAFDCITRRDPDTADIIPCLYLYREFQSEALRILVPFTQLGMDDPVVQSFSAALQLGLKSRFGGQVDHLRVVAQEEPDPTGGPKRRYLMIYDSVPGGTGYLHQLLAHDAHTLKEVFVMARQVLEACPCQSDPEKDGCYRCIYQYRLGRSMEHVSRRIALSLLDDLVGSLDKLERTETISGIGLSHALESVLERRFVESLRRLSKVGGLPHITLIQEIVNGREGYHLQVGDNRYSIEMQADLNHNQGVKRASRPDFLIRPLSAAAKRKPIAVFCDGWAYHKEILRDDAAKRTAILNSGGYWVWSVVSDDVEEAIKGSTDAVLPSPYSTRMNQPNLPVPSGYPVPNPAPFALNAVAELLRWLASPWQEDDPWIRNAWNASLVWLLRLVPPTPAQLAEVQSFNTALRDQLPLWLPPVPQPGFEVGQGGERLCDVRGVWPPALHAGSKRQERLPTVIWFNDLATVDDSEKRREWRWCLHAFNWFQAVPGTVLATRLGVDAGDYAALNPSVPANSTGGSFSEAAASAGGAPWNEALDQMLTTLLPEARKLAAANCPPPEEIGYSLLSEEGEELSMAELAWTDRKIAVLSGDYTQDRPLWETQDWKVFGEEPLWASAVEAMIGENGEVKE